MKQLQPGETFELKNAYVGDKQQLFASVIFNRLTEKQLQKRRAKILEKEKSKNRTYSEKSKMVAGLNVYVTIHLGNGFRWNKYMNYIHCVGK